MPMLPTRTQLRHAILKQLQASSDRQAKIQAESTLPLALPDLPVITISFDKANIISDWSALNAQGQLLEMVEQPVVIKITAAGNLLEEKLEQLAAKVSQSLAKNGTLGGLVKALRLEEDAELSISHEGEQPIGVLTMRFIALYRRHVFELNTTHN